MIVRRLVALFTGLVVLIPLTGQAVSAEEVKGRWDSLSLRDNRIGYYLILKPAAGSDDRYTGMIRFAYRDGREGPRMPLTAVVQDQQITLRAQRGRFDRQPGVLRGELSSNGSSLTLTNCQSRLRLVMARALDSDCVFTMAD